IFDPYRPLHRESIAGESVRGRIGIERIGDERHLLIHHFHADLVPAARPGEEAPTLVCTARVERERDWLDEIPHGGWLQDHRVATRLDRRGIHREARLFYRALTQLRRRDPAPIGVRRTGPATPGGIRGADCRGHRYGGGAPVGEES